MNKKEPIKTSRIILIVAFLLFIPLFIWGEWKLLTKYRPAAQYRTVEVRMHKGDIFICTYDDLCNKMSLPTDKSNDQ